MIMNCKKRASIERPFFVFYSDAIIGMYSLGRHQGMNMMRTLNRILILLVVILTACESATPQPTITPTTAPTLTSTPTRTPEPTSTPAFIPPTTADTPENQSYLRLVHAVPGIPSIDAYIEARSLAFNLSYGAYTEPTGIPAGDYILRIQPSGTRLHEVVPLIEQTITLPGQTTLVILFTGKADAPSVSFLAESNEPLNAEESRINLVHAYADGPQQITLQHNGVDLTSPLDYGQLSNPVVLPSLPSALFLQSGGSVLKDMTTTLRKRFNYTWVIIQNPDDPNTVSLIEFFNRVPGKTQLRVVHGAETIGAINIYANKSLFADNIEFAQSSERRVIPATGYLIEIYPAGSDPGATAPLTTTQFNANEDDNIALVMMGTPDNLRLVRYLEDLTPLPPGNARITFANAVDTPGNVRVEFAGGAVPGVRDLAYRQISPSVQVTADTVGFYWSIYTNDIQGETVEIVENVTLQPGFNYLYLMVGRTDGRPPVILSEDVGINELLAEPIESQPVSAPFRVRFINALNFTAQVSFLVDGSPTDPIGSWQVSAPITFLESEDGYKDLVAIDRGTGQELATTSFEFLPDGDYNVYAYGFNSGQVEILIVQNTFVSISGVDFANIRLVNTSQIEDVLFRLEYDDATDEPIVLPPDETAVALGEARFRTSVPPGTTRVTSEAGARSATLLGSIPTGLNDLYVVDVNRRSAAATIGAYDIQRGNVYEVIAYQNVSSLQVTAFVISYPES